MTLVAGESIFPSVSISGPLIRVSRDPTSVQWGLLENFGVSWNQMEKEENNDEQYKRREEQRLLVVGRNPFDGGDTQKMVYAISIRNDLMRKRATSITHSVISIECNIRSNEWRVLRY